MLEQLTTQMALEQGRDGRTESPDQMLWVQRMNNIRQAAEEIILQSADLRVIEESPLPSVEEQVSFLDGGFSVPEEAQQAFFRSCSFPSRSLTKPCAWASRP